MCGWVNVWVCEGGTVGGLMCRRGGVVAGGRKVEGGEGEEEGKKEIENCWLCTHTHDKVFSSSSSSRNEFKFCDRLCAPKSLLCAV